MHHRRIVAASSLWIAFLYSSISPAAEPFQSGLQPGEKIGSTFEPLIVTGEHAGELHCLVCENGLNPVAMLFARQLSEPVIGLLRQIDAATAKNQDCQMGSFVVFLSDKPDLRAKLEEVAKKQALKHIVLSIGDPAGPEDFKVAPEAELTVVLYHQHVVKANHAFKPGQLAEKSVERIVADIPKILPARPQTK